MNSFEKRFYALCVIIGLLVSGGLYVYSQTPPGPNTIQHGEGINYPTVTATDGYFYGATNITDRLFGDFGALDITTTGDISGSASQFDEYWVARANRTDALLYPTSGYSYIIWTDGTNCYAKNGTTGEIEFSGTDFVLEVLQPAIAAIDALPGTSGGRIFIKAGDYWMSRITNLCPNLAIEGDMQFSTRLYLMDNVDAHMFDASEDRDYLSIEFRNLYMSGRKAAQGADLWNGINFYPGNTGSSGVYDPGIYNCFIDDFKNFGIRIDKVGAGGGGWAGRITHNIIEHCGYAALYMRGSDDIRVNNNKFLYNTRGVYIDNGDAISLIGNFIYHNKRHGLQVIGGTQNSVFNDNIFYTNGVDGTDPDILLTDCDYSLMQNNVFVGVSQTYAVSITANSDNNRIEHNIIRGTYSTATISDVGTNNKIEDNTGYIALGEERSASGTLTAGNANAICFAWNNPEAQDILIKKVVVEVTTGGGTVGSHLDVGIADDAAGTNRGTEFFNDLLLNNVQINDSWVAGDGGTQTKWVFCEDNVAVANDWVVGQILDANAAALVGRYYIEYVGR